MTPLLVFRGRLAGLVRRIVRWGWERSEHSHTVTREKIRYMALLYGLLFLVAVGVGAAYWVSGQERTAFIVWIVGMGITTVFGTISIGWNVLEYLDDRREREPDTGPERELSPDLGLSQDARISFLVTVLLLLVIVVIVYGAKLLV